MKLSDFLIDAGRPVAYYPRLAKALGGVKQAVLLCQLIYWADKGHDADGWIYKTQDEIEEETGLSHDEQRTARKSLLRSGVLEENHARLEHRLYFRVNFQGLDAAWDAFGSNLQSAHLPNTESPVTQTGKADFPKLGNASSGNGESPVRIGTESTTESTYIDIKERELSARANSNSDALPSKAELRNEPLFAPLSEVCRCTYERMSVERKRKFVAALRLLQQAGATEEGLRLFETLWPQHWRYEKNNGRAPLPQEVPDLWTEVLFEYK